jgi:nucleotide-binding universal stress UspA family protein
MSQEAKAAKSTLTTITNEPAPGEETVDLKLTIATPVPAHLKTILIAISDSKHAEYAFSWVMTNVLRKEMIKDTKIILMTVQPDETALYYFEPTIINNHEKKKLALTSAVLRSFRKQLLDKFPGAMVQMIVGNGEVGSAIVDYVETNAVDIVYLGSRSLGMMKRVFLGSVGDYCAHHLKCPVMIIKHP